MFEFLFVLFLVATTIYIANRVRNALIEIVCKFIENYQTIPTTITVTQLPKMELETSRQVPTSIIVNSFL